MFLLTLTCHDFMCYSARSSSLFAPQGIPNLSIMSWDAEIFGKRRLSPCVILDTMNLSKLQPGLIITTAATPVPKYTRMLLKIKCNSS